MPVSTARWVAAMLLPVTVAMALHPLADPCRCPAGELLAGLDQVGHRRVARVNRLAGSRDVAHRQIAKCPPQRCGYPCEIEHRAGPQGPNTNRVDDLKPTGQGHQLEVGQQERDGSYAPSPNAAVRFPNAPPKPLNSDPTRSASLPRSLIASVALPTASTNGSILSDGDPVARETPAAIVRQASPIFAIPCTMLFSGICFSKDLVHNSKRGESSGIVDAASEEGLNVPPGSRQLLK